MLPHLLAADGGYQAFSLGGAERGWLVFALATGIVAIATAIYLMRGVLAADTGTDKMREIAGAIQEGAVAFLRRSSRRSPSSSSRCSSSCSSPPPRSCARTGPWR